MASDERKLTALDVLRITEYRHFILARFFYVMALRMVTTIVGWRIYEITHNPLAIGLIGLSEFIPAFCLARPAGHVSELDIPCFGLPRIHHLHAAARSDQRSGRRHQFIQTQLHRLDAAHGVTGVSDWAMDAK